MYGIRLQFKLKEVPAQINNFLRLIGKRLFFLQHRQATTHIRERHSRVGEDKGAHE